MNNKEQILKDETITLINYANLNNLAKKNEKLVKKHLGDQCYHSQSRVKNFDSAMRTLTITKLIEPDVDDNIYALTLLKQVKHIGIFDVSKTLNDIIGIRIITENFNEFSKFEKILEKELKTTYIMKFINNPLAKDFGYEATHFYYNCVFDGVTLPVELQLKTLDMHFAWEATHDTIYKNDTLTFEDGRILLPNAFKYFQFTYQITQAERKKEQDKVEILKQKRQTILEKNKDIFEKYKEILNQSQTNYKKAITQFDIDYLINL